MSADGFAYAGAPTPEELAAFERNDFGNALRLIRLVGGAVEADGSVGLDACELLFLREAGWIGWNGKHWDLKLGQRLAERTAHRVAQGLVAQAAIWRGDGVPPKEAYGFARSSGNAGACAAMLKVAEAYLQVELEEFDADPLSLTVRNGTLHLQLGEALPDPDAGVNADGLGARRRLVVELRPHDPRDRITRMAPVAYDPAAKCPLWDAKVAQWQPEKTMADYLRRSAGYGFTGHTHEQAFFIFQGKGNDGKSTYMGMLRELAGGYGDVADVKSFLDTGMRSGADASPDLARLSGDCRLISVSEPPRGSKLNEAMIKSFTGGAPIPARRLRQEIFTFSPKPKVFLEANSRPKISGDDEGIWRRIRLVMWEHPVPKAAVDRELPGKLRAEFSGILNWVLAGVGDWLSGGLAEPERVLEAMDDYRKGSSPFGEWFVDRVEEAEGVKTLATHFYDDYKKWCEDQGLEKPMSNRAFGDAMADRQIIRCGKDTVGRVLRMGARLRPRDNSFIVDGPAGAESAGGEFGGVPLSAYEDGQ